MRFLAGLGSLLLVIGIALVIWGVVEMYEGRDEMDLRKDAEIIVEDGNFPRIGVAGAILGSVGLIFIVVGSVGARRSR
jgi:uncharacterized membrane protein